MFAAALLLTALAGGHAPGIDHPPECERRRPEPAAVMWSARRLPVTCRNLERAASLIVQPWNVVWCNVGAAFAVESFSGGSHPGARGMYLSRGEGIASVDREPFRDPPLQTDDRWLAEDKLKHFFASFAITALAGGGARAAGLDHDDSIIIAVSFGTLAGLYKEVADARGGTFFSARDLLWDIAGISLAFLVLDSSR